MLDNNISYLGPIEFDKRYKGSDLHKQALQLCKNIYIPTSRQSVSLFRLYKLYFFIRRKYFLQRLVNYLIYLIEKGRCATVHYMPLTMCIAPNDRCNLRCPHCPTLHPEKRRTGDTIFRMIKFYIDQCQKKSLQVQFYRFGEPLLSKVFYDACHYAKEKGLWTLAHTSLSIEDEELPRKIVECGLCNLVVSCDGATQKIYERFRIGGNVDLVFKNMQAIAEEKRRTGSRFPWVTAKFLVFQHNWHEAELFRRRALKARADEVMFAPAFLPEKCMPGEGHIFSIQSLSWEPIKRVPLKSCVHLWKNLSFDSDGSLFPCDMGFRSCDLLIMQEKGSLLDLKRLWNSPQIVSNRMYCMGKVKRSDAFGLCQRCESSW